MSENLGQLIQKRTDALTKALQGLRLSCKTCREIGFHVAELSPEFEAILDILKKAEEGHKITREDLSSLQGMVRFHWPMHLRPLVRYLGRAFDELGDADADNSEMEGTIKETDIVKLESGAKSARQAPSKKTTRIRARSRHRD